MPVELITEPSAAFAFAFKLMPLNPNTPRLVGSNSPDGLRPVSVFAAAPAEPAVLTAGHQTGRLKSPADNNTFAKIAVEHKRLS